MCRAVVFCLLVVVLVCLFNDDYVAGGLTVTNGDALSTDGQRLPRQTSKKKFHLNTISTVNWYIALAHCLSLDMRLASLESQEEYDTLLAMIYDTKINDTDYWLSGTDNGYTGRFIWMNNGASVSWSNWDSGEPNNWAGHEHCIELRWKVGLKMNDDVCSNAKFHACQF